MIRDVAVRDKAWKEILDALRLRPDPSSGVILLSSTEARFLFQIRLSSIGYCCSKLSDVKW
jgi:hypothetical protein